MLPMAEDDDGGSTEWEQEESGHSESDGGDSVEDEEMGDDEEEESAGVHGEVAPAPSTRAAVEGVTVVDADALECGVCCRPLRPPIFQCEVGHVVCSPCRDKLAAAGNCHVCGVAVGGGYRRCHALEQLVESIRVACPHAAHGCPARPAYYDLDAHQGACPHAPCHCPGVACGFVGSTAALLDHFAAAHNWSCITEVVSSDQSFSVLLQDGFNFILADHSRCCDATASHRHRLIIMLNMTQQPLGHVISVLGIHPHAAAKHMFLSQAVLPVHRAKVLFTNGLSVSKKCDGHLTGINVQNVCIPWEICTVSRVSQRVAEKSKGMATSARSRKSEKIFFTPSMAVEGVTAVVDADALKCGVCCCRPLRPPIF
ncbi:hypothetical protein GUJ93_ZPchr0005g15913 [Zizania palustris]|uniref:RING-type E3 ubiquitin transferase n=1 Tax=Zizania palustris TaxID=103762 RepID=A0A8J5VCP3_ZIZPA|nr:hypothetical protein GUJ93_ZPchr0005g15913 [Zizania palustris]